jgi:membrane protein
MKEHLLRARRYLRFLWREYNRDRCGQAAASLAFGTLLSLVPLAALLAWLTRPFQKNLSFTSMVEPLSALFTPTDRLQEVVQANVERYADNAATLGILGLLFFLFVAYGMLSAVYSVINDIWHVRHRGGRVKRLARFWSWVVLIPLLFLASATLKQSLEQELLLRGLMGVPIVSWILADLLPFLMLATSAALVYWIMPQTYVRWKSALIGGVVSGLLYHLVRRLFVLYLDIFATYDRIYGILGVIPAFLVWLFFVWSVLLVGAEVAFTLQHPWDEELPP